MAEELTALGGLLFVINLKLNFYLVLHLVIAGYPKWQPCPVGSPQRASVGATEVIL